MAKKYIDNIDECNALLFNQILEGKKTVNDLCKIGKPKFTEARKAWVQIYDEYILEFGLPDQYIDFLDKLIRANRFRLQAYTEEKDFLKICARIEEAQAFKLVEGHAESIQEIAAKISKFIGFAVSPAKTSVRDFYSYLTVANNE